MAESVTILYPFKASSAAGQIGIVVETLAWKQDMRCTVTTSDRAQRLQVTVHSEYRWLRSDCSWLCTATAGDCTATTGDCTVTTSDWRYKYIPNRTDVSGWVPMLPGCSIMSQAVAVSSYLQPHRQVIWSILYLVWQLFPSLQSSNKVHISSTWWPTVKTPVRW